MADMTNILSGGSDDSQGPQTTSVDTGDQIAPQQAPTTVQVNDQGSPAPQTTSPDTGDSIPPQATQNMPVQPQQPAPTKQPSVWERVLTGALVGLSGVGPHARTFGQGLAGGAQASVAYNQQQEENKNQQAQLDMQKQRLAMEQQQSTDQHATAQQQLAVTQAQLANLNRQYALAPKTLQDVIDQKDMDAGAQLTADGFPTVGENLSKADALSTIMAHRNADPNSALQYITHQNGNGTWNVWKVTDPNKLNDAPLDVTLGYDSDGKPITKNYGANTITVGQRMNVEANALTNYVNQQNSLAQFKKEQQIETDQAGPRAYATASAQAKVAQQMTGAPKDANGNWNPSSLPVMLVEGQMDPSQLSKRSKDYNAQLSAANQYSIERYGKPFDIAQAQTDYRYANQPTTQNTLKMINGMTDQGGAIDIATQAAQALPQTNSQTINKLFNATATEFGSAQETNFHTAILGLADEYSKIMGGGVSSDTGRQQSLDILKAAYSRGQIQGAIGTMRSDVSARKSAIIGGNRYLVSQYGQQPQGLPRGNGQQIDSTTAQSYLKAAGGDPTKARQMAGQNGWKF